MRRTLCAAAFAFAGLMAAPASADVHVGVHVAVPPPPVITFAAPPRLVVVPGVPHVHYAPDVSVNFFAYGGHYYTHNDGYWYVADESYGPWHYVERRYVPASVLSVPVRYYHVPPRLVAGGHWSHRDYGRGKAKYHHDRHGDGHGKHGKRGKHGKH